MIAATTLIQGRYRLPGWCGGHALISMSIEF
jgi:hypothetical protein